MSDKIKQTIKCDLNFNHLDPHYARFHVSEHSGKKGQSKLYGMRPINITTDMFPADFELARYDVRGTVEIMVEITEKE
jgi:hypothetical protein